MLSQVQIPVYPNCTYPSTTRQTSRSFSEHFSLDYNTLQAMEWGEGGPGGFLNYGDAGNGAYMLGNPVSLLRAYYYLL